MCVRFWSYEVPFLSVFLSDICRHKIHCWEVYKKNFLKYEPSPFCELPSATLVSCVCLLLFVCLGLISTKSSLGLVMRVGVVRLMTTSCIIHYADTVQNITAKSVCCSARVCVAVCVWWICKYSNKLSINY